MSAIEGIAKKIRISEIINDLVLVPLDDIQPLNPPKGEMYFGAESYFLESCCAKIYHKQFSLR